MELTTTAHPMIEEAKILTVHTVSDRQRAADLWDAIRAFRKQAEAQKEEVCRPLKQEWDDAKKPFDTFVKECQGHETTLQGKMSAWDREQDRLARLEQEKIQAAIDAKNAKIIEKAEAKGIEPVLKVAPIVQAPSRSIETQAGTISTRSEKKVYEILGVENNENVMASDVRAKELAQTFPHLFVLDWVAFRKVASTGMLDTVPSIKCRVEYVYTQRGGK